MDILEEIEFDALNVKYLVGAGAFTYGLESVNFSDLSERGMHGIIYLGAGSSHNKIWIASTNPHYSINRNWEYIAKEDLGFVFFMDIGGLYNSGKFYLGGKIKVGGFFSGEIQVNGEDKTDQLITGTIEMEAVGGYSFTKNLQIGFNWKMNDENNRNESGKY